MPTKKPTEIEYRQYARSDPALYGFATEGEYSSADLREYLATLWRRRTVFFITMAIILTLGLLYVVFMPAVYESSARIVVGAVRTSAPISEDDVPLLSGLQALVGNRSVDTQVEIISSPDLLNESFNRLTPVVRAEGFASESPPKWAYRVRRVKNTDMIMVTARAYTPKAAADFANTICVTYFDRDLSQIGQLTKDTRVQAGERLAEARKELVEAQAELSAIKQKTGLFAPDTQLARAAEQIAELSLELDATRADYAAKQREVLALRKELAAEDEEVVTSTTLTRNLRFSDCLQRIDRLGAERAALLQDYTQQSREVRAIDSRIQDEQERLKQIAENVVSSRMHSRNPIRDTLLTSYATNMALLAAAAARGNALRAQIEDHKKAVSSMPERERVLSEHMHRVALLQRDYEALSSKYYALLLSEQFALPSGRLVSKAEAALHPSRPSPKSSLALFLVIGLIVAGAVVAFWERVDHRVHAEEEIEEMTGSTALAVVPKTRLGPAWLADGSYHDPALLESFRILRNNLSLATDEQPYKILAVTSAWRQEGKSTTTSNLAVTMAMDGKRVLVVDADMRRPSLHKIFRVPREPGLSQALADGRPVDEFLVETAVPNVWCLPAGPVPHNPPELMNSERSRELFRALAERFDAVLIDCPPATGLSDMLVISGLANGVLLVVSMNQTLRPHLAITARMLARAKSPLVGLLLNRMDMSRWSPGYYYSPQYGRSEEDYNWIEPDDGDDKEPTSDNEKPVR